MGKDKGAKAAAPSKASQSVKSGRVTKPAETSKSASKATAKNTAKAVEKKSKKTREPTPESSDSESEEDSEEEGTSDSSESEEEANPAAKTNGVNGKKIVTADDDVTSEDEDSSEDEEEETAPAKTNGANGKAKAKDSDDSEEDSDESESDEEEDTAAKAEAGDDEDDSDDSEDSSDDDEEEEKEAPKVEEKNNKKRKAEADTESAPKRGKIMIDGNETEPTANLFVGKLSFNIDEEWLTREFEEFGELQGVRIITDRDSGRSKGFGYVEFTDLDNAIKAQEAMHGKEIDGFNIRVDFSQPRGDRQQNNNFQQRSNDRAARFGDQTKEPTATLFVGNVSFDADENALTEAFQSYGSIQAVRLPTDRESGQLKGYGYIEMSSVEEAKAALEACQGMDIGGRPVRLDYAQARSNDGGSGGGRGGRGGFGGGRGRGGSGFGGRGGGGFGGRGGGRGGRGGFGDRGRGGRGGGRGGSTNRGGFGDFSGRKTSFD